MSLKEIIFFSMKKKKKTIARVKIKTKAYRKKKNVNIFKMSKGKTIIYDKTRKDDLFDCFCREIFWFF